jgi:hypothetical protein
MVGGTIFLGDHPPLDIQREISRVLVPNFSGEKTVLKNTDRRSVSLTKPSLLSRGILSDDPATVPRKG